MQSSEHLFGLYGPADLVMDIVVEAAFAEGGIVSRKIDHRSGFAFRAVH
jgi:hypothetical protein